jgi:DNA-binding MarR family transcriptional regulator
MTNHTPIFMGPPRHDSTLLKQIRVAGAIREIDAGIPLTTVAVFLQIAAYPSSTSKEITTRLGISQSATSRHLADLSDHSWTKKQGLGLIEVIEDPLDRRTKRAFLTFNGQSLVKRISAIVEPDTDDPSPKDFLTAAEYVKTVRRIC